jgi:hypothetical protein
MVLVIEPLGEGDCIAGEEVHARERKDLNRMRAYLKEMANRWGMPIYPCVQDACAAVVERHRKRMEAKAQ